MQTTFLYPFNEVFVIFSFILTLLIINRLPKIIPISIIVLIIVFSANLARIPDSVLAAPNLDLYDIMLSGKYNFFDLVTYLLYCPFGYLFIYFYVKWDVKGYYILLYVLFSSIIGTSYEWLAHLFGVFEYKEWKIQYSLPIYLFVQPITLLFYEWIKKVRIREIQAT